MKCKLGTAANRKKKDEKHEIHDILPEGHGLDSNHAQQKLLYQHQSNSVLDLQRVSSAADSQSMDHY